LASQPLSSPIPAAPTGGASARLPEIGVEAVPWREMSGGGAVTQWDALAQWAASPNPFLESWFLLPALEAFDTTNRVYLLRVEADGILAGLLPIARAKRYYRHPLSHWGNWTHANCFLGAPLVARGFEKSFWRALLGWADDNAAGALFLHLAHQPLDGALYHAMIAALAEQERPYAIVHREQRALLASQLAPEAYLEAALSPKKRKELRRQHKRLAEQGALRFERRNDSTAIDEWIEAFLWLEATGWKGNSGSAMANGMDTMQLFTEALRGAAARGRLERLTFSLDGEPIAMLANFISPPGSFAFKTAFDERFARFSPGVLLQRENLALLEREGIAWCDSCASSDHPMIDHLWRERRTIGRVSIAIGGAARRAMFRAIAWAETRRSKDAPA
jgi:CelD/BcsL family acetyltransferase involved in cellulose biosynthesis